MRSSVLIGLSIAAHLILAGVVLFTPLQKLVSNSEEAKVQEVIPTPEPEEIKPPEPVVEEPKPHVKIRKRAIPADEIPTTQGETPTPEARHDVLVTPPPVKDEAPVFTPVKEVPDGVAAAAGDDEATEAQSQDVQKTQDPSPVAAGEDN